jgi:hypothetical protein
VSVKKARGKGKGKAKRSAKEKAGTRKGKDIVEVRGNIDNLVKDSAEKIAIEVIKVALTGQLATAKYLFEAVGLYPATEQTTVRPIETSLAHTLLTRMGLPLEPVICDEDPAPAGVTSAKSVIESNTPSATEDNLDGEREEESKPTESEEWMAEVRTSGL